MVLVMSGVDVDGRLAGRIWTSAGWVATIGRQVVKSANELLLCTISLLYR